MKFPIRHAMAIGASIGVLSGAAISLFMGLTLPAALVRIGVLTFAAAWGGAVLAWLDRGLHKATAHTKEPSHQ